MGDTLRTLSLCDSYREFHPTPSACDYTCWRNARYWSRAQGERLDHVFCDPQLLRVDEGTPTTLSDIYVDQSLEGSDHAAVVFEMSLSGIPTGNDMDSSAVAIEVKQSLYGITTGDDMGSSAAEVRVMPILYTRPQT